MVEKITMIKKKIVELFIWRRKKTENKEEKIIDSVQRDEICSFCNQRYGVHPLDLPYYTIRTLCDGRHIRP